MHTYRLLDLTLKAETRAGSAWNGCATTTGMRRRPPRRQSGLRHAEPGHNAKPARPPGAKGVLPGWADDEKLEALRAEWFAATDDAARREIAAQIQQRAFEVVPFIPLGQCHARAVFRSYLTGVVGAPIAFLRNIE